MRFTLKGGEDMLGWAVVFLIIAIVAAVFGFGGIAAASAGIAKFLFFLFLMMFTIFLIFGGGAEASPDPRSGFRRVCGFDVILLLVCSSLLRPDACGSPG